MSELFRCLWVGLRGVALATASHHSFDSRAGGSTLRTAHRSSGSRQPVNVVESSDEVADTKLPRGARPEALVSATEPLALGLRACRRLWKCGCNSQD